jgi:hypothetical protein
MQDQSLTQELRKLYFEIKNDRRFNEGDPCEPDDDNFGIVFGGCLSVDVIRFYHQILRERDLPLFFIGGIAPSPEIQDYAELMQSWVSLYVNDEWDPNFKEWLHQMSMVGRSFPGVQQLRINNLRFILDCNDIPLLRRTFPNLQKLFYMGKDDPDSDPGFPTVLENDLETIFSREILSHTD